MSHILTTRDIDLPVDWQDGEIEYDGLSRPIVVVQAVLDDGQHTKCAIVYAVDHPPRELGRVPAIYAPPHLVRHPSGRVIVYGKGRTGRTMHLADVPDWAPAGALTGGTSP